MKTEYIKMRSGALIPNLAFGTWQITNEDASRCVNEALEVGYIHIDTANAYENEKGVGEAIRSCGISREKLFITTKVPAEMKTYEDAKKSIEESYRNLGLEYIDLLLIHAPKPWD